MKTFALATAATLMLAASASSGFAQAPAAGSAPLIPHKNPAGVSDSRTDSPAAPRARTMTAPATTGSVNNAAPLIPAEKPAGVCDNRTDSPAAHTPGSQPC
jgi:hypothetical protein